MKTNNQKGFIIPLLIGIIALLIIGGGAYIYSTKNAQNVTPLIINSNLSAQTTTKTSTTTFQNTTSTTDTAYHARTDCPNGVLVDTLHGPACEVSENENNASVGWKTYTNTQNGFSFQYPSILQQNISSESVTLNHSIVYKHSNPCDFKGDSLPQDMLTDFDVSFTIVNKNLKDFVQSSAYPGWDYVSKNPIKLGSFIGYKIMSGIEGCGKDIYYFTISPTKTLIINRSLITEFNPIIKDYKTYLSLPGIISPDQQENYFNQIIESFKFTN